MPTLSKDKFQQQLYRRYLLWAYKSTRESFERIERKTTQLVIDQFIQSALSKKSVPAITGRAEYQKLVSEFDQYIAVKKADELALKYTGNAKHELNPQYIYLNHRLQAIEQAIKKFLGAKALKEFEQLFEQEFTERILNSKDH